jgi:hypothetical protein
MHILYLHQHFSTPEGSTATRSFAFARSLAARGHRVTLATGRYQGAETGLTAPFRKGRREGRVAGFRVVEWDIPYANAMGIAARSAAFLRYAVAAARLALRDKPDLVIASCGGYPKDINIYQLQKTILELLLFFYLLE